MWTFLAQFFCDEDGAITVDWVVLTAALLGISIVVMIAISDNIGDASSHIETELSETPLKVHSYQQAITGGN